MERMANYNNAYYCRETRRRTSSRTVSYGDRIFVRVTDMQRGWTPVAEFELHTAADMSEIYGELRFRTRGRQGLMKLYVRNATRGWSFEQPFKLYGATETGLPASSVCRQPIQPQRTPSAGSLFSDNEPAPKRAIPDSIKTYLL